MADLKSAVEQIDFHKNLNPALWMNGELRLDVRVSLLKSAWAFVEFIDMPDLKIDSIHLTGSNASYNYTEWSDCDIHIIVDFEACGCPTEIAENLFMTKKTLWNALHGSVRVNGFPVELYVEDKKNPVTALGVYDLLKGTWVREPKAERPSWDSHAVLVKALHVAHDVLAAITSGASQQIEHMFARLKKLRRSGLSAAGEFSTENLAFKTVRNLGYIEMLAKARQKAADADLSLDRDTCREPICEELNGGLRRCTVQTVNAFASFYHFVPITRETDIPIYGSQVIDYLKQHGLHGTAVVEATGQTVRQFVNQHRTGTYYISTDGHAMALINGNLVDAAEQGPDQRPIITAVLIKR